MYCSKTDLGGSFFRTIADISRYNYPNYDVAKLVKAIVGMEEGRQLIESFFYVGYSYLY